LFTAISSIQSQLGTAISQGSDENYKAILKIQQEMDRQKE
jgi:hypothetical protein